MKISGIVCDDNTISGIQLVKISSQYISKSSATNNYKSIGLNFFHPSISFERSWKEHKSWGAHVDPKTKNVTFKLFSFPDNKSVSVEIINKDTNKVTSYRMTKRPDGVYVSQAISPECARHGDSYRYVIERSDGTKVSVKDPYSYCQKKFVGESVIYDHSLFEERWSDKKWFKSANRISRLASKENQLGSISELRIYEFNTKTFSKTGDFKGAKAKLQHIKDLGFNAIEIMPVEVTYSFNWGYDGVDKMAVSEHLGGPDDLKLMIDYAHSIGLNVIMDMVPNHFGPDGCTISQTGPYTNGTNDFGEAINYEGQDSRYVRDFMVNAAINWVDNYHCDGLRLDMTKYMNSDFTMKQIAAEMHYHFPHTFLIAEDARSEVKINNEGEAIYETQGVLHDERVINAMPKEEYAGIEGTEKSHEQAIAKIDTLSDTKMLARLGYDTEWDFPYFHELKENILGNVNREELYDTMVQSGNRVKYIMSHDEIGNKDGTRLIAKLMTEKLNLGYWVELNEEDRQRARDMMELENSYIRQKAEKEKKDPKYLTNEDALETVKNQKVQLVSEKLVKMLLTGELDKYPVEDSERWWMTPVPQEFNDEILAPLNIREDSRICAGRIRELYSTVFAQYKLAMAHTYSVPGPKMVFQGDERADITSFRFFREFETKGDDEKNLFIEKGYKAGESAYKESILDNIEYTEGAKKYIGYYETLMKDLNSLPSKFHTNAINDGEYIGQPATCNHNESKVLAVHTKSKSDNSELFTISNFDDCTYPRRDGGFYMVDFPEGTWVEILNTDDEKYGGEGYINTEKIKSDGTKKPIRIGRYSTMIFKKIK